MLRDHDTVRIYKPWLTAHQLSLPKYVVREDTPNTLINEDLETFFAYFQTLAVSVNLYAIIDAIQDLFGVSEHELMSLLKQILKNEVATISWVTTDQLAVRHIYLINRRGHLNKFYYHCYINVIVVEVVCLQV